MRAQFIRPSCQPIRDGTIRKIAEATGQGYAGRNNSPRFLYCFNFLTIRPVNPLLTLMKSEYRGQCFKCGASNIMRWWLLPLAAIGIAHAADAGELDMDRPPASKGYGGIQTFPRPHEAILELATPPPARAAPYRPVIVSPAQPIPVVPPAWSWTRFYVAGHLGGGWGNTRSSDPFGASIYGDNVSNPMFLSGAQAGYNWQAGPWVYGVELATSGTISDGTNTCLAFSGFYVSSDCHANPNFLATAAGRIGLTFGALSRTLAYVKGGAAWINNRSDIVANNQNRFFGQALLPQFATNFNLGSTGVVVGAGDEE
jgi:hypothetical protein